MGRLIKMNGRRPADKVEYPLVILPKKSDGNSILWDTVNDKPAEDVFDFRTVPNNTGTIHLVPSQKTFSQALTDAQRGDTIKVTAGTVVTINVALPSKTGTGRILIQPDDIAMAALPLAGERVTPTDFSNMYTIRTNSINTPQLTAAPSASGYRIIGARFTSGTGVDHYNAFVNLCTGWTSKSTTPKDIVIDRCSFEADPAVDTSRGIAIGGEEIAVTGCHFTNFGIVGADSQAAWWYGYSRRTVLNNCYLDGDGETIMLGGADQPYLDGSLVDTLPGDIMILNNEFDKVMAGSKVVKNMLEVKYGERGVAWGNVFKRYRSGGQSIVVFIWTVNQGNTAAYRDHTRTNHWLVRSNLIYDCEGFLFAGVRWGEQGQTPTEGTHHVEFSYNLSYDAYVGADPSQARSCNEVDAGPVPELIYRNNTSVGRNNMNYGLDVLNIGTHSPFGHRIYNNIFGTNATYGFHFGSIGGTNKMDTVFGVNNYRMDHNLAVNNTWGFDGGTPNSTGTNISVANQAAVLFTDVDNDNYLLQAGSPGKNAGSDGRDMGCCIERVLANTAGVVTG